VKNEELMRALQRGRSDVEFFWQFFLKRTPHPSQLEFLTNAEATVNLLPTSNRWGKTTLLCGRHFHRCIYKIGAEPRFLNEDGTVDARKYARLKYRTIHTADLWDTASLVWEDAHALLRESDVLQVFVKDAPRSKPPHIDFINGSRWKFRTLGDDARGIDGDSYYYLSVDEAGWIDDLIEKIDNVLRVRIADVRGVMDLVGTMKPGVSRDYFKLSVKASAYTGRGVTFEHRDDVERELRVGGLDPTVVRYLREAGIDLDDYAHIVAEYEEASRGR
jgi:hypothetical protein